MICEAHGEPSTVLSTVCAWNTSHSLAIQKTTQTCQHPGNVHSGPNKSRQSFKSHRLRRVEIEQHIPQFEEIPCDRLCVRLLQAREEFVSAILSVLSSLRALFPTARRYSHHCVSQAKYIFFIYFFLRERSGRGRCAKALACCCESSAATYISTRYLSVSLSLSLSLSWHALTQTLITQRWRAHAGVSGTRERASEQVSCDGESM